ncbi:helix-turn-helix domain-containing protein [Fictibacillus sp. KU28468]|uniref:helix-turn-helix domain-containing protein n=1 Tax=Fictibacillus sp. KU28468 TaxID=2991053 RepID=UPI00223DFC10|nr:helix-turn-helix transcriptional regulator [Fictibacillus sp. KU28468]UZJ79567.1 helix-turn-helix transcriptional regulator [Fictibacillus sp. KU28468]
MKDLKIQGEKVEENTLGYHLKQLRKQHKLTRKDLAAQLEVSSSYIGLIETNKRLPKKKKLQRYASTFNEDIHLLEELLEKQKADDESVDSSNAPAPLENDSLLKDFISHIKKVQTPFQESILKQCLEIINEHWKASLVKYSLTDLIESIKKELSFQIGTNHRCVEGLLQVSEENNIFFRLFRNNHILTLELPKKHRDKIDLFERWVGPHDYSFACDLDVPHLIEKQAGAVYTWFSPQTTLQQQFEHICNSKVSLNDVLPNSSQLAWFIQQNSEALVAV